MMTESHMNIETAFAERGEDSEVERIKTALVRGRHKNQRSTLIME